MGIGRGGKDESRGKTLRSDGEAMPDQHESEHDEGD
jgi:hypothetical protein